MLKNSGKIILLTSVRTFDPRDVYLFREEFFNENYIDNFILKYYTRYDGYDEGEGEGEGIYMYRKGRGRKYVVVNYDS